LSLKKILILCLFIGNIPYITLAQKTIIYNHPIKDYNTALDLFDKEKYAAAQEEFNEVYTKIEDKKSLTVANAKYYSALCGLKLFNIDAEDQLIEFIEEYPENPKVKLAYFHLGRYKFRKKKYKDVLYWFKKIDLFDLNNDEIAEYQFKKGYSLFMEKDYENASKAFYEIKDTDNQYASAAKYYYGHIAYIQGKNESALLSFQQLTSDQKFGAIVPYYITQIYYLQKKYDELIAYAPNLLENAVPKRVPEIARLIGESYYKTKKFEKAIPYLEKFQKEEPFLAKREDYYELGYAYYKIDRFKKSIREDDSLSQTAYYNLADCYLKVGEKRYARSALREASDMDFDPQIKEDALFSYAKIAYELSYHPYNDAIKAFEEFINTYPKSPKLKNAYQLLVTVYYSTKNYKAALSSLENIKNLDNELQKAYQKIAFYNGVDLFNNYQDAINNYKIFIFSPLSINSTNINLANYNLGYSYFKIKEYTNANNWFRKFVENETANTKQKNDALNRIGDCFFINKDYIAAIEYYDKSAMVGLYRRDYAYYQSAIANGVIGKYNEKENLLLTLLGSNQKTNLNDDAIFELGKTQLHTK